MWQWMGASSIMLNPRKAAFRKELSGFTIIELLMVLAILLLGVGLFVVNVDNAIEGVQRQSPTEVLLQSFREARLLAVTEKRPVFLSFDEELARFELRTEASAWVQPVAFLALDEADRESIETVRFWPIEPWSERANPRELLEFRVLDQPFSAVRFEPSGISNFVAVQWAYTPGISDPDWMLMDPFSSAELEGELE